MVTFAVEEMGDPQSGECALINTSFNRHEEPIVRTDGEAFINLENGVVDVSSAR